LQDIIKELGERLNDDLKDDKAEEDVDTKEYSTNVGELTMDMKNLN